VRTETQLGQPARSDGPYFSKRTSGRLGPAMNNPDQSSNRNVMLARSRDEAACAHTVDRLNKRGLLRPSRVTGRPMYPIWEVERFLRESVGLRANRRGVS
jgi:hypothetical protein